MGTTMNSLTLDTSLQTKPVFEKKKKKMHNRAEEDSFLEKKLQTEKKKINK